MSPLFLLWSLLKLHCESVSRSVSVFPVALESTFEATCPQAPFYHPPASALTTSLSRTLPEVSGLALSPLSARGTACDSEKENSSGSTDAVVSQVHYGTWRIRAQPVWVPRWTQLGQTSTDWTLRVWLFVFCVLLVSHVWTSSLP